MHVSEMIAALDRDIPGELTIYWGLDDAWLSYGDTVFEYHRKLITDLDQHIRTRGYTIMDQYVDPRGGIEGTVVYIKG